MVSRRKLPPDIKAKIVLKALKEQHTAIEIASEFQVHPIQIAKWKKQAIEGISSLFETQRGQDKRSRDQTQETADLYEQVGRLKMQLEWLKKKSNLEY